MNKAYNILIITILMLLCCSCEKELQRKQEGSFVFKDKSYYVQNVRINHFAYEGDDCLLSLQAYPSTFRIDESGLTGYGSMLYLLFSAKDENPSVGEWQIAPSVGDTIFSHLISVPKEGVDTVIIRLASGRVVVDSIEDFIRYKFYLQTIEGDSITGSFEGKLIYNYSVDQLSYGSLSVDTIQTKLAQPVMWQWGNLFSSETNFFELVFYSADARFYDSGKQKDGIHFVLGFNDFQQLWPSEGIYPVGTSYSDSHILLYGHRTGSVQWGSYWQYFVTGSNRAKANILSDTTNIIKIDENNISIKFMLVDQMKNVVEGSYDGPYQIKIAK